MRTIDCGTSALLAAALCATTLRIEARSCLPYEPKPVTLAGTIVRQTFPGPPNYEDVKTGDTPEMIWVLRLATPICVAPDGPTEDYNDPESNVRELQLIFMDGAGYTKYRSLLGKPVSVSGTLSHAITGHHHTKVMVVVREIAAARK
jgi:hypothetical protein